MYLQSFVPLSKQITDISHTILYIPVFNHPKEINAFSHEAIVKGFYKLFRIV